MTFYTRFVHGLNRCSALDGGNWVRVRHVGAGNSWHPATDRLRGTDTYGNGDDSDGAWSKNFEASVPGYDQFLFATGDCKKWLISSKDSVCSRTAAEATAATTAAGAAILLPASLLPTLFLSLFSLISTAN